MKKIILFVTLTFAFIQKNRCSNPPAPEIFCPKYVLIDPIEETWGWSDQWIYLLDQNSESYSIRVRMNRVGNVPFSQTQAEQLLFDLNTAYHDQMITFYWDCIIHDTNEPVDTKNAIDINISDFGEGGDTPQMPGTQWEVGTII